MTTLHTHNKYNNNNRHSQQFESCYQEQREREGD